MKKIWLLCCLFAALFFSLAAPIVSAAEGGREHLELKGPWKVDDTGWGASNVVRRSFKAEVPRNWNGRRIRVEIPGALHKCDAVVYVNAGAGYTDGIYARHMRGCALHCVENALIVVLGIGIDLREPNYLLGVNALSVNDGAYLSVASACIKADTATVKVSAYG